MLFDVWLFNPAIQLLSPDTAPTWLGRWFAATSSIAVTLAASATGNSANVLQATPVVQSAFQWHP